MVWGLVGKGESWVPGCAEVGEVSRTGRRRKEKIRGFDVPVNDVLIVEVLEG